MLKDKRIPPRTDKFASDRRALHNLASAYHNTENEKMRVIWENKWYEMCKVISRRIVDRG